MRAFILSVSAAALAACGGQGSSSADEASAPAPTQLAQATTTTAPAASAASGPDLSGLPEAYQGANLNNGRQQWFLCAACHQIANGTSHSVGPDLRGVFGDTAGTNETFPLYSPALKESGIVWTAETMDAWIANPRDVLASTTMIFPGMRKPEDRRDVIAYLWVESGGDAE
jgi:cytochrome c